MHGVHVPFHKVSANRTAETRPAREEDGLMKRAARSRIPSTHHQQDTDGRETSAESRAVMRDERHQSRIDSIESLPRQSNESEIFRYEHLGRPKIQDDEPRQRETRSGREQPPSANAHRPRSLQTLRRPKPTGGSNHRVPSRRRQAGHENRQKRQSGDAVPAIEVSVPQVRQETAEPKRPADQKGPPCPRGASAQRKESEPQIQDGHSEESAAERDAVVKHEAYDPAVRDGTELHGGHAEKRDVVREEFAPRRQEYR